MQRTTTVRINPAALRTIREALGIQQGKLAVRGGIKRPHLANIEAGRREASPKTIRQLADALGVPMEALIRSDLSDTELAEFVTQARKAS